LFAAPNVVAAAEAQTTAAERKAPFHPTPQGQRTIGEAVARVVENARPVPTGSDVAVPMGDGELTFNAVTHRGVAEIVPAADLPGQLPSPDDFKLQAAYLVAASAAHSGGVEVSLPAGSGLALFHYVEGKWQQVQSSFNGTYLSGTATSLSWFAVGTPVAAVQAVLGPATAGEAPAPVTLDASQSTVDGGGAIASYSWDFGDGATGSGPTPTHVYADAGTYRVTVTVTAQDGAVDTAAEAVTVTHAAPHAVIETPSHLVAGEPAQFGAAASSASAGPVVWDTWVFGDGSEPAAGAVVTHTFHNPGTYRVLLSVRDGQGYTDAVTTPVTVTANQSAGTGGNGGRVAPAHRAPVRVGGRAVRRGLRILVALACPGGTGDCVGTLLVRRAQRGHYRMLGSVRYRVKAGAIKTVGVTIPRRRAHLAVAGTKVSLLATEANGGEVAASRRLKRPSPRRRR
jgi:PKD repeat protein